MSKPFRMSDVDYDAFEARLVSTSEGRSFLRQRDAKMQLASAARVRRMMRKFQIVSSAPAGDIPVAAQFLVLRQELRGISDYIQRTRTEIASLQPDDAGQSRFRSATSELDAVVAATEQATCDILNGVERIQEAVLSLPKTEDTTQIHNSIVAQLIEIMTACSFQDITGQRLTKVVNALHYIEQRVNAMVAIWGAEAHGAATDASNFDARPDAHLLNGPPLAGGVSQVDVDALFSTEHDTEELGLAS